MQGGGGWGVGGRVLVVGMGGGIGVLIYYSPL